MFDVCGWSLLSYIILVILPSILLETKTKNIARYLFYLYKIIITVLSFKTDVPGLVILSLSKVVQVAVSQLKMKMSLYLDSRFLHPSTETSSKSAQFSIVSVATKFVKILNR